MAKETMLTYLDRQLTKKSLSTMLPLDWDARNHTIELVLRLFAENPNHLQVDDAQGVASEEERSSNLKTVFYCLIPKKSSFAEEDFWQSFPTQAKRNPKALLDAFG